MIAQLRKKKHGNKTLDYSTSSTSNLESCNVPIAQDNRK